MTSRLKVTVVILAGAIVTVSLWTGAHAFWPGQWPSGTPVSLRLPRAAYVIPGMDRLVRWQASAHASQAAELGRWSLFGYGSGGNEFGLAATCELLDYSRGTGNREALPAWASQGVTGTAELRCPIGGLESSQFVVAEMSCMIDGPDYTYAVAYNREIVRLRGHAVAGPNGVQARGQ